MRKPIAKIKTSALVEELPRHMARLDSVVPVAVEIMATEIDPSEIGVGDFGSGRIGIGVDLGMDLEAGFWWWWWRSAGQ
jgi:hypothetical protein